MIDSLTVYGQQTDGLFIDVNGFGVGPYSLGAGVGGVVDREYIL